MWRQDEQRHRQDDDGGVEAVNAVVANRSTGSEVGVVSATSSRRKVLTRAAQGGAAALLGWEVASSDTAEAANVPGAITIVNQTVRQSIPSGALTSVSWNFERRDDLGGWVATKPDRIVATVAGVYMAQVEGCWSGFTIDMIVYHHLERIRAADGIQEVLKAWQVLRPTKATSGGACIPLSLSTGDAIRLRVYQDSGTAKTFGGKNRVAGNPPTDSSNTEMSLCRLS
jgi:hypothetical protein